jgi:hypothetical protein
MPILNALYAGCCNKVPYVKCRGVTMGAMLFPQLAILPTTK